MHRIMMTATAALLASAIGLAGCGSEQSQTETTTQQAEPAKPAAEMTDAAAVKAYPLDYCIISGEKLGSMGDPVVKTYEGHEVKFCCGGCIDEFESHVTMYLAKIDSAAVSGHDGHDHGGDDHSGHDHSHGG